MENLNELLELALDAYRNGDEEKAIGLYKAILSKKEDWAIIHYNLGLIYKYRKDWNNSFAHNLRAIELAPDDEAAQWNLGIAATMTQDWKTARQCWNFFGLGYEINAEDPAGNVGVAPIRINADANAEVVWATRIDPARAVLNNIPFPESAHRFGDVVLNDGAPNGYRTWNGQEYAVFDELEHLSKSDLRTFSIRCDLGKGGDLGWLETKCEGAGIKVENWTKSVRMLCKQCSEGRPHELHDRDLEPTKDKAGQLIAFAADSEEKLLRTLREWSSETGIAFQEFRSFE